MSPDSKVIKEGMIRCTEAITRILDTTNCFEDVSATIAVSSVVKCLKPPAIPKGTAKLLAFDKFKGLRNPKPKDTGKKNMANLLKPNTDKKKKKDPLDPDKDFLKGLIKELDESNSKKY